MSRPVACVGDRSGGRRLHRIVRRGGSRTETNWDFLTILMSAHENPKSRQAILGDRSRFMRQRLRTFPRRDRCGTDVASIGEATADRLWANRIGIRCHALLGQSRIIRPASCRERSRIVSSSHNGEPQS